MAENSYYLNIEGYYDKIHRTTWARRTSGMLAGATLGAAYGAAVGLLAAFVPYLLNLVGISGATAAAAVPAFEAIGKSIALFAAVTAGLGMAVTAEVAANSAASAVGMEEKERREKMELIHEQAPAIAPDVTCLEGACGTPEEDRPGKGPPLFSWKVAAITMPLFAAFGALIALNPFTSAAVLQHAAGFPALTGAASVAASAGIFGLFGSFTGMKSSLLTNQLSNFYYNVVTERIFNREPQAEVAREPQITKAEAPVVEVAMADAPQREKRFAAEKPRFSLQDIINREGPPAQDTLLTR